MVKLQNLKKSYRDKLVLKGINYEFKSSQITAVLGPNASGKTTTIKSILGLIKIDSGEISFAEKFSQIPDKKSIIGYMPQYPHFPENLTILEIIKLMKSLRNDVNSYDLELLDLYKLEDFYSKKVNELSGGTLQKLSAIIAFMFHPKIIILDEPTAGLDPKSALILKDKIRKCRSEEKSVIISTHIINEIDELADEIVYLLNGNIQFQGKLTDLKSQFKNKRLDEIIVNLADSNEN